MSRKKGLSRILSFVVMMGMLLVSLPGELALAAEDGQDTFLITEFEKLDSWKMEKTSFEKGTAVADMKFPTEWTVKGYMKSDESGTVTEKTLEELEWTGVLKGTEDSESKTAYSKEAGEGEYYFSIKLPENVEAAKDVEVPEQLITITGKTEELKTEEPKTEEPKTEEPKTEEPKTEEPKTEEPKTEEPKTEEPKTEEPKTEEPKTEEPKTEEPKTEEPKTEEPKTEEPKTEEPKTEEPKTEEPKTEEPKTEEPKTEEPGTPDPDTGNSGEPNSGNDGSGDSQEGNGDQEENKAGRILSFTIGISQGIITENEKSGLIEVVLPHGTEDITGLTPVIQVDEGSTVSPESEKAQDFTNPVEYTVRTEQGEERIYTVKVTVDETHDFAPADCTNPKTCKVCGATEGEPLGHDWKAADCTNPKTCTRCGKTVGKALGHDWKAADCTNPRTCKVCGATEGEALGHDWKAADCTNPKTCKVCGITEGEPLGHKWSEWVLTKKPTENARGVEERICTPCQTKETREVQRLNRIGEAKNNKVTGIKSKGVYGVNEKITITAQGAWMDNKEPIKGDVRYLPVGWKVTSYNNFTGSPYQVTFTVKAEGQYQLQVTFQKQSFDGKQWINEKDTDTKTVDFTISRNKAAVAKTGDDTMIAGWAGMAVVALAALFVGYRQSRRRESR